MYTLHLFTTPLHFSFLLFLFLFTCTVLKISWGSLHYLNTNP